MITTTFRPRRPVDVAATLAAHRRGTYDPAFRLERGGAVWRTCRPDGAPATVRVEALSSGEVSATAWGPGASDAIGAVPDWLGQCDDPGGFAPEHDVLRVAFRRCQGCLIGRTGLVMEALVPAILEQKVTSVEAYRSWAALLRWHCEPAPGPAPAGMKVVPEARRWAQVPSWAWHRAGVGPQRSRTIVTAALLAAQLEEAAALASHEADRRLRAVPGIGAWTSAEVRQRVHGDPDALSVGDANLPHIVSYALTGERRGSDERMLELLAPYQGHRHRAAMMLMRAGPWPARRAPRAPLRDYRRI